MSEAISDETLLDAWRDGDRGSGSELFERHFDSLYRFFAHKNVGEDIMDLLQQTLLASVEGLDKFRGHSSVRTYLFAIARYKLLDYWRARSKHEVLDFGVSSVADLAPSPSSVVRNQQRTQLLLDALKCLPLDQQIAVELHYWEGLSGPELADVLAVPEGTVRGRLHRARQKLREHVEQLAADPSLVPGTQPEFDAWASAQGAHGLPMG